MAGRSGDIVHPRVSRVPRNATSSLWEKEGAGNNMDVILTYWAGFLGE